MFGDYCDLRQDYLLEPSRKLASALVNDYGEIDLFAMNMQWEAGMKSTIVYVVFVIL